MNFNFYELFKKLVNSDNFTYELKNYEKNFLNDKIKDNLEFGKLIIKEDNQNIFNNRSNNNQNNSNNHKSNNNKNNINYPINNNGNTKILYKNRDTNILLLGDSNNIFNNIRNTKSTCRNDIILL